MTPEKLFSRLFRRSSSKNGHPDHFFVDSYTIIETTLTEQIVDNASKALATNYAMPSSYNRELIDSASVKINSKREQFELGTSVVDPYTNQRLVLTIHEAKKLYGESWQHHLAEADHVVPLKKIHEQLGDALFLSQSDIKEIANNQSNVRIVSRAFNNSKRHKNNTEFVENSSLLRKNNINLNPAGKNRAIKDEKHSKHFIVKSTFQKSSVNLLSSLGEIGQEAAAASGSHVAALAAIDGISSLLGGKKLLTKYL